MAASSGGDVLQRRKPEHTSFGGVGEGRAQLMMTAKRNEFQDFVYLRRKEEVQLWLEDVLQLDVEGDVIEALRDGTLLCQLMNRIVLGAVPKVHKAGSQEFFRRENVTFFVDACVDKLGIPRDQLFESADLCDLDNPRRVIGALLQLEAEAARRGFTPCISRFKEEPATKEDAPVADVPTTYAALEDDDVDAAVGHLLQEKEEIAKPRRRKVKRLAKGKYVIDGVRLNLKQANGKLMVRVGGGWMPFREFFEHHKLMDQYEALTAPGAALGPSSAPAAQRAMAKVDMKGQGPVIHVAVPEGFVRADPLPAKKKTKAKNKSDPQQDSRKVDGAPPVKSKPGTKTTQAKMKTSTPPEAQKKSPRPKSDHVAAPSSARAVSSSLGDAPAVVAKKSPRVVEAPRPKAESSQEPTSSEKKAKKKDPDGKLKDPVVKAKKVTKKKVSPPEQS
eukprot:TRINITY_DN4152_c0_g1_i2.p1 TRINITY_DN4152_c0_g1~~TRINITY_DN4152_c0_g1_i2.p1  ORF type:complete len:446 (-),score=28.16 TRINITY_DN4152_c0_g1_i2:61-1398(-)